MHQADSVRVKLEANTREFVKAARTVERMLRETQARIRGFGVVDYGR
jgi:hypothetical protein